MKKLTLIIAAIALSCNIVFSQGCLPAGIYFFSQDQIDNFQANYPGCTEIEGDVTISGPNITNLDGLNVLTSIGSYLSIGNYEGGNPALTSLSGLDNLTSIGGSLMITQNDAITSMTGLDNLTTIGGDLSIYGNPALTSLSGLESLASIGGGLGIGYNDTLASLNGLESLAFIGGWLSISGNEALANLSGLESLTSIGGGLEIQLNYALNSLSGLENLTSIGGGLHIGDNSGGNPALTSLNGLENLTSIGGDLAIYNNNALTSLSGLDNLTSIGGGLHIGDMYIGGNPALASLVGLASLTSIGGGLYIEKNNALTSLTGLDNIEAASITNLLTRSNSSLSTCEVQSICDYLAAPNGTIQIINNAPGCNSFQEVQVACETVDVDEPLAGSTWLIFPNPANNHLTIQLSLEKPEPLRITLLNVSGQQMAVITDNRTLAGEYKSELDILIWPAGVYICRIQTGNETITKKIMKVQ
ncbi:MAG: T9SS type A sorting domain-containing protein [Lentimicrobium sp.]